MDAGRRWAYSPDCFNEAQSKTCTSPHISPFVYDKWWKLLAYKKIEGGNKDVSYVYWNDFCEANSFCWQGADYCGKSSLTCVRKTKQNKTFFFLWCCFAVTRTTSFLFIWDCRFQWAGMWWAYLMFCTLSGNVPAPKTEQSSGTHLKCNPDTQLQNTFFFCPLLSLFLFLRWSSYWKQLGVEVWVLKIWGKYQEDETKLRAGQKMKRVKQNLTIKLGERKQQH